MVQLPDELLQLICEHFHPYDHLNLNKRKQNDAKLKTLKQISQADRALRRVAQPIIMHTLDFRKRDWKVLRSTLQLILDQPHLAAFVRKVLTSCWKHDEDLGPPSERELKSAFDAVKRLYVSRECRQALMYQLKYGYAHGFEDPELALLMSLCEKFEDVDLECPGGEVNDTMVMKVMADSVSKPAPGTAQLPFRRIRDVKLRHGAAAPTTAVSNVVPLFYLPNLYTLSAEALDNRQHEFCFGDMESPVRKIHLYGPVINSHGLKEMLVVCPRLTSLALNWGRWDPCWEFGFPLFGDVLRAHATNLKKLHIIFGRDSYPKYGERVLGPLRSLSQLTDLKAPAFVLFDHNKSRQGQHQLKIIIPPSLQSLSVPANTSGAMITATAECLAGQLNDLMQDTHFTELASLEFDHATCLAMTRGYGVRDSIRDKRGWLRKGPLNRPGEPVRWKLIKG